jgi:hypothetical protein
MGKHTTSYREPSVAEYWLVVNDLHSGSEVAPMPKKVEIELQNGEIKTQYPNPIQRKLNGFWDYMTEHLPPLTGVICNGDMCEGPNRKSLGHDLWTTNLRTQVQAAAELLAPIKERMRDPRNFYGTLGSEYHTVDDRPLDQAVCEAVKGQFGDDLVVPALHGDFRIHVMHFVAGSSTNWTYLPTTLARGMMELELANAESEYGDINWVFRAHRHLEYSFRVGHQGGNVVPSWQGRTKYAVRKGIVSPPKIGYAILKIYEDGTANVVPFTRKLIAPVKEAKVFEVET